jgi:hypothetical protein
MMARQVLAVGAPAVVLILARAMSMRGLVASPTRSSPRAGRMWFLRTRRQVSREVGGAFPVGDQSFESLLPEVEEVVDLVYRGELAGLVGPSPVLELLQESLLGSGLGAVDGGHVPDDTIVIAEFRLRPPLDGLAVVVGLDDPGGDASPGPDRQGWSRHVMPPTGVVVGRSTPWRQPESRTRQRCEPL